MCVTLPLNTSIAGRGSRRARSLFRSKRCYLRPERLQEARRGDLDALEGGELRDGAGGRHVRAGQNRRLGEHVGRHGRSKVRFQVGDGPLARHLGSHDEADEAKLQRRCGVSAPDFSGGGEGGLTMARRPFLSSFTFISGEAIFMGSKMPPG